ncbi:hypothetical protein F5Y15DRAFT_413029 [Xylariaceae sp. FL0016]|nr:hypothetical protein F5Y15DRAFT_413029 [Xylariaceae sp. FL0016]
MLLQGLRDALPDNLHPHLTGLIEEIRRCSKLLRELADRSQVHASQIPIVMDYLNVILPCLSKSLRDITDYYNDKSHGKERRWRKMYHEMGKELPGTTLPARFVMYFQFINLLQLLLTRSPNFDLNAIEILRRRILELREARQIPRPSPIRTEFVRRDTALDFWSQETQSHWAEAIFTQPLPSRREFRKQGKSDAYGPMNPLGLIPVPQDAKILVKRSFANDQLTVTILVERLSDTSHIMVRSCQANNTNWVSILGTHELCISRTHTTTIGLHRWCPSERRAKIWAALSFMTWEELVLFYCTFVGLKSRSPSTYCINPKEFKLHGEEKRLEAHIIEDGYDHQLVVWRDRSTGGCRIHAVVRGGEQSNYPVWTAFIPDSVPDTWFVRKSRCRIWLRDIQIYTLCDDYRAHKQRKGRLGAFELHFRHEKGCNEFRALFKSAPDSIPPPTVESAESSEDDASGPNDT